MYYKWLTRGGRSPYAKWQWPLPTQNDDGTWTPGEWTPYIEELQQCLVGYHGAKCNLIEYTYGAVEADLYEIEYKGEIEDYGDKVNGHTARLPRKIGAMDARKWRLLACDCSERVLHIFEDRRPGDTRPRNTIAIARRYAKGQASLDELDDARDAAWDATRTARDAASAAASAAARDGAGDAAWDAAWAAEREWQDERLLEYVRGER